MSEKEEDKEKVHNGSSRKTLNEDQDEPVKKTTTVETAKSNEKTPKRSTSKIARNNQNSKGKVADKKRTDKSSKALVKDGGWVLFIVADNIICTKSNASLLVGQK